MLRLPAIILMIIVSSCSPAESPWPKSCDDAVEQALQEIPVAAQAELAAVKQNDLIQLHHSLGRTIRNEFGLWSGNAALLESCSGRSDAHPDDVSMIIIEQLWAKLQN